MGAGRYPRRSRFARTGCAENRHRSGPCPGVKPGSGPPNPWAEVHGVIRPRAGDPLPGGAHLWAGRIGPRTAPRGRPRESARACGSPCTAPRRTASECRSGCGAPLWTRGTGCAVERSPPWPEPQAQDRHVRECTQGTPRPKARKLRAVKGPMALGGSEGVRAAPRGGLSRNAGWCGSGPFAVEGPAPVGAGAVDRRGLGVLGRGGVPAGYRPARNGVAVQAPAGATRGRAGAAGCLPASGGSDFSGVVPPLSDGGARPDGSERPRVGSAALLPGSRTGVPCGTGVVS